MLTKVNKKQTKQKTKQDKNFKTSRKAKPVLKQKVLIQKLQHISIVKKLVLHYYNNYLPIVAMADPSIISKSPKLRALQAFQRHLPLTFPLTTCTFH